MHRAVLSIAVGLLLGVSSTAWGLGLGRGAHTSTLGEPLSFSVQVNADVDEILAPECVAAEVFAGDVKLQPPAVTVSLQAGAGLRQATVRVVTTQVIEEPVVTVSVGLGCPQSVSRKFVLFVDPPVIAFVPFVPIAPIVALEAATAANTRSASAPTVATSPRTSSRASAAARPSSNVGARAARAGLSSSDVTVQERNTTSVPALRTNRQPAATRAAIKAAASAPGARQARAARPHGPHRRSGGGACRVGRGCCARCCTRSRIGWLSGAVSTERAGRSGGRGDGACPDPGRPAGESARRRTRGQPGKAQGRGRRHAGLTGDVAGAASRSRRRARLEPARVAPGLAVGGVDVGGSGLVLASVTVAAPAGMVGRRSRRRFPRGPADRGRASRAR